MSVAPKVGVAAASWDLAQIDLARADEAAALPRLRESQQIFVRSRLDGVAVVGWALGQRLAASGETEAAREVLTCVQVAAMKVEMTDLARAAGELLGRMSATEAGDA